ncbi:hypothetical protein [Pseudomonas fluorescens]|uniref:hypothetical protein n=1 Tax=Pseudomonas fluorescens TaxID=294 RepID=UPI00177BEBC2|nr:hypothetical protein [Pseudomonas fluorescens]
MPSDRQHATPANVMMDYEVGVTSRLLKLPKLDSGQWQKSFPDSFIKIPFFYGFFQNVFYHPARVTKITRQSRSPAALPPIMAAFKETPFGC